MRRNILITGASGGLGAEMARQFAAKGHRLALTARRVDKLQALRAELVARHRDIDVVVHRLDVTEHDEVFAVFRQAISDLGGLDRVVVNAGLGKGGRIGTGRFEANKQTIETNLLGALAQCEASMEHFYERREGHLVLVSSVSGLRAMPSSMNVYGATKAALAHLGEGIRMDLSGCTRHGIKVTTIHPGYIASAMNSAGGRSKPFMVDTSTGVAAMVDAIDREVEDTVVPRWPWAPVSRILRIAPRSLVRRLV